MQVSEGFTLQYMIKGGAKSHGNLRKGHKNLRKGHENLRKGGVPRSVSGMRSSCAKD